MVLLNKRPPKVRPRDPHPSLSRRRANSRTRARAQGRRLLILSTTSNRAMLSEMDAMDAFATSLRVPALTTLAQLRRVLQSVELFPRDPAAGEVDRALGMLEQAQVGVGEGDEARWAVGVKRLLSVVEMCRQDEGHAVEKLVTELVAMRL